MIARERMFLRLSDRQRVQHRQRLRRRSLQAMLRCVARRSSAQPAAQQRFPHRLVLAEACKHVRAKLPALQRARRGWVQSTAGDVFICMYAPSCRPCSRQKKN